MAPVSDAPSWRRLTDPVTRPDDEPVRPRRIYAQVLLLTVLVLAAVAVVGAYAAQRQAEGESVTAASRRAELLADVVITPALTDGVVAGDPAALDRLDRAVRENVLGDGVVRVKLWTRDGTIVYSDEARLIGAHYDLEAEEVEIADDPDEPAGAEVTDLEEPENRFERDQGKLLEVYQGVRTPSGEALLFETYATYDVVTARGEEIRRGFVVIVIGSLLALMLLLLPIVWRLLRRLRRQHDDRERLLHAALGASDAERRRIAATLHDGVVQELAATSFVVAGAANRAAEQGDAESAASLEHAAGAVRGAIGGLRSLLVDIYPATLADTGLATALADLATQLRSRDIEVGLQVDDDAVAALDEDRTRLVFGVAQETLRNAARHAGATRVDLTLRLGAGGVVLEVADDGVGFDVDQVLAAPEHGHFGVRLLVDAAARSGAGLAVLTTGEGTRWRLEVR